MKDSDFVETWIKYFTVLARIKKYQDNKINGGENEITDLFLAVTGCEAIR